MRSIGGGLTVDGLLDLYLDGIDADGRLSAKTRFDYRRNADAYVRPWLGHRRVRELTPDVILAWQRELRGSSLSCLHPARARESPLDTT